MTDKNGTPINVGDFFMMNDKEYIVLRRAQDDVLLAKSESETVELESLNSSDIELIPDSPDL